MNIRASMSRRFGSETSPRARPIAGRRAGSPVRHHANMRGSARIPPREKRGASASAASISAPRPGNRTAATAPEFASSSRQLPDLRGTLTVSRGSSCGAGGSGMSRWRIPKSSTNQNSASAPACRGRTVILRCKAVKATWLATESPGAIRCGPGRVTQRWFPRYRRKRPITRRIIEKPESRAALNTAARRPSP